MNGSAEAVTYAYDSSGRPTSVCSSGGGCYAQSLQYNVLSQPTFRRHGNNAVQRWSYDRPLSRLDRSPRGLAKAHAGAAPRSPPRGFAAPGPRAGGAAPGTPDRRESWARRPWSWPCAVRAGPAAAAA